MKNKILWILCAFVLLISTGANAQHTTPRPERKGVGEGPQGLPVSCCDWMMLKRQKLGAITLSKEINADGLEMDMGGLGRRMLFDNRFRPKADSITVGLKDYTDVKNGIPVDRKTGLAEALTFKRTADSLGIKVSSIAMSGFFAQNVLRRKFAPEVTMTDAERIENYRALMCDLINTMNIFGAKVAFLPLGGSEHQWETVGSDDYKTLVERLRMFGKMAEKAGVVIGVRTAMPADFDIQLLKDVKSKGIKIYYNFQDACDRFKAGQDKSGAKSSTELICNELKMLGTKHIVQIHVSNTDRVTLRHDTDIDMPAVKATLESIGYKGWLTVERSRNAKDARNTRANYGDNVAYLHEVFSN